MVRGNSNSNDDDDGPQTGIYVDAWAELAYNGKVEFTTSIKFEASTGVSLTYPLDGDGWNPPLTPVGIPSVSITVPGLKFLERFSPITPELGLFFAIPFTLEVSLKSTSKHEFKSVETFDLGNNVVKVGMRGDPLTPFGFLPYGEEISSVIEEPSGKPPDQALQVSDSFEVSLEIKFGVTPQFRMNILDLSNVGVGFFGGMEFKASYRTEPYAPDKLTLVTVNCETCHSIEASVSLVAKDLLLIFKPFKEEQSWTIVPFELRLTIFKLCLMTLLNHITCGDTCCDPTDICEQDSCGRSATLSIQAEDPSLMTDGGVTDEVYVLALTAENIPDDYNNALFEWSTSDPNSSIEGSIEAPFVSIDGRAWVTVEVSYSVPGYHTIYVSVYGRDIEGVSSLLSSESFQLNIKAPPSTAISILPPSPLWREQFTQCYVYGLALV